MKSRSLLLIRHCEPVVDRLTPTQSWDLSNRGHADALALATSKLIVDASVLCAGAEPKMAHSLKPAADRLGITLLESPAFMESHGSDWLKDDEFHTVVRRFFDHPNIPPLPGWESAADAVRRFMIGISELDQRVTDDRYGPIVICSGGRLLTAFLISIGVHDRAHAFALWRAIRMPDICIVEFDLEGGPKVAIPFGNQLWSNS